MVAMTAPWTVPASGAQFPFGPCHALRSSLLRRLTRPHLTRSVRSPCDTRPYVHASLPPCTWPVHVYRYVHEATKRATFRRACFLRVSAPVGQTNRPTPTSSNQPVRRPLRLRSLSPRLASVSSTLAFSFWFGCRDSPPAPRLLVQAAKRTSGFISGVARCRNRAMHVCLSKSCDYPFTSLTGIASTESLIIFDTEKRDCLDGITFVNRESFSVWSVYNFFIRDKLTSNVSTVDYFEFNITR